MLLEKELEELADWFAKKWPDGKFSGHAGYDTKDQHEEYNIVFTIGDGRHFHAPALRVPAQVSAAPREELDQFRKDFIAAQKRKIEAAVAGLVF